MLYLVRHGESVANVDPSIYLKVPNWDIPLSEKGGKQAMEAAWTLKGLIEGRPALVYTSPFKRTRQTWEKFSASCPSYPMIENPLLSEREWGTEWRRHIERYGLRNKEDFRFYAKPFGAESFAELYTRVQLFFQILKHDVESTGFDTAILFTHGEWIKITLMIANKMTVEEFDKQSKEMKIENGEIIELSNDEI